MVFVSILVNAKNRLSSRLTRITGGSSIPGINNFKVIEIPKIKSIIENLGKVLDGLKPAHEWDVNDLDFYSSKERTELVLSKVGNVTVAFDTSYAKQILERWDTVIEKYLDRQSLEAAVGKTFLSAASAELNWTGELFNYHYRLEEVRDVYVVDVYIVLDKDDVTLTVDQLIREIEMPGYIDK